MRKYILVIILLGIIFTLYLLSQPSLAIEFEKCKGCHGAIIPIPKNDITKSCSTCHGMHASDIEPRTRVPEDVHNIHATAGRQLRQTACQICHQSPIDCAKCHNSHPLGFIKRVISVPSGKNITGNITNITGTTGNVATNTSQKRNTSVKMPSCIDCHGNLPQPKGHEEFRWALSESKHRWMNCDTCHLNPNMIGENYIFELRFKNLFTAPIGDSIKICKICHSSQYERMKEGTHGTLNNTCVNCHNPHTTTLTGPKFQITPKETPANMSVKVEKGIETGTKWLTEKIPILNNPTAMFIILILLFVFVSEYVLSRHEEGQKVTYDMIKFKAREETLKTLEIKLKSQNINFVNQILQEYGNILGMTMTAEENKEDPSSSIYKYVIFINMSNPIDETGENDLVGKISSLNDIKSVEFTDKYEL